VDSISATVMQFLAEHGLELALSAISFFAATVVSYVREKRLEAENAKLQKDVDQNKELLSRQGGIINAVLSQQQKSQSYTIERQAQAAEQAWKEVLRLRELSSPCVSIDSVLLPSERHGEILYKVGGLKPGDGTQHAMEYCRNDHLEELRPYLGEELWIKFFALRAFSCRCLIYYDHCVSEDKNVIWAKDDGIRQMLGWVIKDEKKISNLYSTSENIQFLRTTQETLEGMVYDSISQILTGKVATEDSIRALSSLQSLNIARPFLPSVWQSTKQSTNIADTG